MTRFQAKSADSLKLRFHTQTAGSTLTAQQPLVNVVRTSIQALAAVCGGTQSLHTNAYDEALGLPTEAAALLALRTQQVIANESGIADIVDPLGGSFAVETETDRIESEAQEIISRIDRAGGMVQAIEARIPQREIEEASYRYQRSVESGKRRIVGINTAKENDESDSRSVFRLDPSIEREQRERVGSLRAQRDNSQVTGALDALRLAAQGSENIMPLVCRAVEARATVGEISAVLRQCFGEYHP